MRPTRRHRRWLAGWLIALMLFMQWATAAYACPKLDAAAADASQAAAMAAMPGCSGEMAGMDPDQPQLCKAHCEAGRQSVNAGTIALDAPVALAHGGALLGTLDAGMAAERASAMPPARAAGAPPGTPPLYLALLVLRN